MTGFVKPKDIMKVRHKSVHALIIEMETVAEVWGNALSSFQTSTNTDSDNLLLIDPLVQKATSLIPTEVTIKNDKILIGNLKPEQCG